jgi:hypothetical protein
VIVGRVSDEKEFTVKPYALGAMVRWGKTRSDMCRTNLVGSIHPGLVERFPCRFRVHSGTTGQSPIQSLFPRLDVGHHPIQVFILASDITARPSPVRLGHILPPTTLEHYCVGVNGLDVGTHPLLELTGCNGAGAE